MSSPDPVPAPRVLIATVLLMLAIVVAGAGWLDDRGADYSDGVFRTALATFAVARGLDAAISMAQGTEIAMQPAGVGLTVSAGELLDPVNDLVEQFSWVMLVSTTSLGIQSVLLRVTRWPVLTFLFALVALARLAALWKPDLLPERIDAQLRRVLTLLIIVRFAMPLFAIGSAVFFDLFLDPARADAVNVLEETTGDIRAMEQLEGADDADAGWRERVSAWFAETVDTLDIEARLSAFRDRVTDSVEHVVSLIVVFTVQTILLPLAFLWLMPRLLGRAVEKTL